jgi:pimeloyl-ACP methyl ester carboxylesterase
MTLPRLVSSLAIIAAALVALALITDAVAVLRQRAVEAAFPPLGQIMEVDGVKVHALTRGSGPDLILIHGASGNLRDLLPLMDALTSRYRVTAFDRPGLGWTEAIPDGASLTAQAQLLSQAAAQLDIHDPILLGQSYGGAVALAWTLYAPLKPRALVLVSAPSLPWPGKLDPWYQITDTWVGRHLIIPLVAAYLPDSYIDRVVTDIFKPDPAPKDYLSYIGAGLSIRRQTLATNSAQVNELREKIVAQSADYARLTLPIELIHGTADTIVPMKIHSEPLSKILPQATLTVIDGAGHMPHHSRQATVIAAIARADVRSRLP